MCINIIVDYMYYIWGHSWLGYYFLYIEFKDFVFVIFQIQNLHEINLNGKYWIIQIILIFMVVVIFHMCM